MKNVWRYYRHKEIDSVWRTNIQADLSSELVQEISSAMYYKLLEELELTEEETTIKIE